MALSTVEYLLIDGQRYGVKLDAYSRINLPVELPQLTAKRTQSPFIDAEVVDFSGGIAPATLDDATTTYGLGLGLDVDGDVGMAPWPRLKVGRALDASLNVAGAGSIRPLLAWRGYLYAGEQGSDSLYRFDGTTWTLAKDFGASTAGVAALAEFGGQLYASLGATGDVWVSSDGTTWGVDCNVGAFGGTFVLQPLAVGGGQTNLYIVNSDDPSGFAAVHRARVYGFDGTALLGAGAPQASLEERYCYAGVVAGSTLYLCGAESAGQVHGTIYSFDGTALRRVVGLPSNFATSACEFLGRTYWGCSTRGELYELAGGTATLLRSFATTLPLRGLFVFGGALWVAVYNDADARLALHRYDGTAWAQPHYLAASQSEAGGLAAYGDALYVGAGVTATTRRVYRVSGTNRCTAARLETPDVVYGSPALLKTWRRIALGHAPLLAGQAVQPQYRVDGGAWVTLATNRATGSTATVSELPDGVRGRRLRAGWDITNGAAQDLTLYSATVRALPSPSAREVWEATLLLGPPPGGAWASDATADTLDAVARFEQLRALRAAGSTFQAVDVVRSGGVPVRAMLATLDQQTPLEAAHALLRADVQVEARVRLVEAGGPSNLLDNASFEQDAAGSAPTSWALSGTVTSWQTVVLAGAADGVRVLAITYNGASATPSVYQVAAVVPGRWYTLSGSVRRAGLAGGSAAAYLRVSEASVPIAGSETTHMGAGSDASLIRYQATFKVPASSSGTVAVECYASGTPTGAVYWDAVMLEAGAPASAFRERGA